MARVCAVFLQCSNIPCRIVYLANPEKAYNGYVVCEAYYEGRYGVIDPIYGYMFYDNTPISAYDPTSGKNDYTISVPNAYTLKLIDTEHNDQWIMGEDR